jgi:hypothetical protein
LPELAVAVVEPSVVEDIVPRTENDVVEVEVDSPWSADAVDELSEFENDSKLVAELSGADVGSTPGDVVWEIEVDSPG